jgi:hypothetical protein
MWKNLNIVTNNTNSRISLTLCQKSPSHNKLAPPSPTTHSQFVPNSSSSANSHQVTSIPSIRPTSQVSHPSHTDSPTSHTGTPAHSPGSHSHQTSPTNSSSQAPGTTKPFAQNSGRDGRSSANAASKPLASPSTGSTNYPVYININSHNNTHRI